MEDVLASSNVVANMNLNSEVAPAAIEVPALLSNKLPSL